MSQIEHFDAVAEVYDELRSPGRLSPIHELIAREARLEAGRRLLDIGCGTGSHAAVFTEAFGCSVAGVDPSPGMLGQARSKLPDADLRLATAEKLPFADRSFHAAVMMLVVQHLDRPRAFREAKRVLLPDGSLAITTSNPDAFSRFWMAPLFPSYVEIEQARFPSAESLEHDLEAAGFRSVRRIDHVVPRSFSREEALAKLRGRHASTFDLLDDGEFRAGLERAERELPDRVEYSLELVVVLASG